MTNATYTLYGSWKAAVLLRPFVAMIT